jgi:hypothetical protein
MWRVNPIIPKTAVTTKETHEMVVLVLGTCFSATDGARYDAPAILRK